MISVIIPTYNRANTIVRSIDSVLNQTYKDIELIVVDDGSTDNTKELVLAINDSRIRYIYQDNAGACVARNTGIDNAKGEYIAFQDSDDEWVVNKLELQLEIIINKNADVCFCSLLRVYDSRKKPVKRPRLKGDGFISHKVFCTGSHIGTPTILAKREVLINNKFDPIIKRGQDTDWAIRASENYSFYYLDKSLHIAYLQEDAIVKTGHKVIVETRLYWLEKYKDKCLYDLEFYAWILKVLARNKTILGEKDASEYYKRLYEIEKTPRIFLELCLSKVGVLSFLVRCRNKIIRKKYI